jgi:hypothetical protein
MTRFTQKYAHPVSGDKFGRWTVIDAVVFVPRKGGRDALAPCRCDCGTERMVSSHALRRGDSRSCGCTIPETNRKLRRGLVENPDRFWSRVTKQSDGCWIISGNHNGQGYRYTTCEGRRVYAHRAVWEQLHGPIPADIEVCHRCDVPACVNPDHLFLGTRQDNVRDMYAKGRGRPNKDMRGLRAYAAARRAATHCKRGHPFENKNTQLKNGRPSRYCQICRNDLQRLRKLAAGT